MAHGRGDRMVLGGAVIAVGGLPVLLFGTEPVASGEPIQALHSVWFDIGLAVILIGLVIVILGYFRPGGTPFEPPPPPSPPGSGRKGIVGGPNSDIRITRSRFSEDLGTAVETDGLFEGDENEYN